VLEERTADLLERTRYTTRQLLTTAGLEWKDIGRILLTGGSTRMPMVQRMLRELSGIEPDRSINPDEAVARGAAIYANYLLNSAAGTKSTFDVSNVNAHSLGVEIFEPATGRKRNRILIPRNTPLPAGKTDEFVTREENQRTVVVQVLEGESLDPAACSMIGRAVIRNLPPNLPRGSPVTVTYEYGANGRLSVRAKMVWTDHEVRLDLERSASLSADRLKSWKLVINKESGLDGFHDLVEEELALLKQEAAGMGLAMK
jgi:molecular chaperone DnaK